MKHLWIVIVIAATTIATAEPAAESVSPRPHRDSVVARVGDRAIKRWELEMAIRGFLVQLAGMGRPVPGPDQRWRLEQDVLDEITKRELVAQAGRAQIPAAEVEKLVQAEFEEFQKRVGGPAKLAAAFEQFGVTQEEYLGQLRDNLIVFKTIENHLAKTVVVTPEEVRGHFDANRSRFQRPEMVRVSTILIQLPPNASDELRAAKKAQINAARALITDTNSFAATARRISEDPASGPGGGDLGYFTRGRLPAEMDLVAFALRPGQVSEPFEGPGGFHVLMVTDRRAAEPLTFEQVKENIEAGIRQQKGVEATREYVRQLGEKTKVEILLPILPPREKPASTP